MDKEKDDNLLFFVKPDVAEEKIKKMLGTYEKQADNLSAILNTAIAQNNFHYLFEYLYSEITMRMSFLEFCEKIEINPAKLREFFHKEDNPNLIILSKILNGLDYKFTVSTKEPSNLF